MKNNRLHDEVMYLLDRAISLGALDEDGDAADSFVSASSSLEYGFMEELFNYVTTRLCGKAMLAIRDTKLNESEEFQRLLDAQMKSGRLNGTLALSLRNKFYYQFRDMVLDKRRQKNEEEDNVSWLELSLNSAIDVIYSRGFSFTFGFVRENRIKLTEFLMDSVLRPMLRDLCAWREIFVLNSHLEGIIVSFMEEMKVIYDTHAGSDSVLSEMNTKKAEFLRLRNSITNSKSMCTNELANGFFVPMVSSDASYMRPYICSVMRRWVYDQAGEDANRCESFGDFYPRIKSLCGKIHEYVNSKRNNDFYVVTIEDMTRDSFSIRYNALKAEWISSCSGDQSLFETCFESHFVLNLEWDAFYKALMTGEMALGAHAG